MKKILFILTVFLLSYMPSYANYMPVYVNHNIYYGESIIAIRNKAYIYKTPDETTKPVALIDGEKIKISGITSPSLEETFIATYNDKNIYMLPVKEDNDEWYQVCYNQRKQLFGWVKKSDDIDFIPWNAFFNFYGRKYGVYLFRNVDEKYKKLYASPDLNSNVTDTFNFPKHISLWLMNGDWMLVKVLTYDGQTKTGWIKWRLEDGSIIMFPKFE